MESGKYTAYKLLEIIFLIILIPFLFISSLAALTMLNTKNAGGYPNMFGYYVVEVPNNSFYDAVTGKFQSGATQMFKSTPADNIMQGDIVAYYCAPSENPIERASINWKSYTTYSNQSSQKTVSTLANSVSPVTLGKISGMGTFTASDGLEYVCFSIFSSNEAGASDDIIIVEEDIIGVAIENSSFLMTYISFQTTTTGLIALIVVPILILVVMNIVVMLLSKSAASDEFGSRKDEMMGGGGFGGHAPPPRRPQGGPPPRS